MIKFLVETTAEFKGYRDSVTLTVKHFMDFGDTEEACKNMAREDIIDAMIRINRYYQLPTNKEETKPTEDFVTILSQKVTPL
jgi:hypothetical protein